jgi:hypothetical protein
MKYLKTIDFVTQSLILGGYAVVVTWTLLKNRVDNSLELTTAFTMLCLGWWQMISAGIMLLVGAPTTKFRLLHFFSAIGYLAAVAVVGKYIDLPANRPALNQLISMLTEIITLGVPVILALFYYYITWRWVFPIKPSGKFLPHISF